MAPIANSFQKKSATFLNDCSKAVFDTLRSTLLKVLLKHPPDPVISNKIHPHQTCSDLAKVVMSVDTNPTLSNFVSGFPISSKRRSPPLWRPVAWIWRIAWNNQSAVVSLKDFPCPYFQKFWWLCAQSYIKDMTNLYNVSERFKRPQSKTLLTELILSL